MAMIDEGSNARIESEIAPSERLLWSGRPILGSEEDRRVLIILILAVLGLASGSVAYYLIWLTPADFGNEFLRNVAGGLCGAMIYFSVLASVGSILTRSLWARRLGTLYALTDRRAIVWLPGRSRGKVEVYSFPLESLKSVHRVEKLDGSGDLFFLSGVDRPFGPPRGFTRVAEIASLDALFREALASSKLWRLRETRAEETDSTGFLDNPQRIPVDRVGSIDRAADALDPDFEEALLGQIKPELVAGEELLWVGHPPLTSPDEFNLMRTCLVAMIVLLGGWLIAHVASLRFGDRQGVFGILSGALLLTGSLPALPVAFWFTFGHFDRANRKKTLYAVTDRRAIRWRPSSQGRGVEVESIEARWIVGTHRTDYLDGTGDLLILEEKGLVARDPLRFLGVVDAAHVERLLREMVYSASPLRGWTSATR